MSLKKNVFVLLGIGLLSGFIHLSAFGANSFAVKETVTISAAASLTDALTEIQKIYETTNKSTKLQFNFGGSGALKKQIEEGAPVDLFIAADQKSINDLDVKKHIVSKSKTSLLGNNLVLLVNKEFRYDIKTINDLKKENVRYICLGVPESVPAGAYAKESLKYFKLWDTLGPKYVFGKDVKQVLSYVETGDAVAGFVYSTDAKNAKNSWIAQVLPAKSYTPIIYSSAVIAGSAHEKSGQKFLDFLKEKKAQDIFKKYGFTSLKK